MMKTLQKGFTLIELMIVVAIIGILAAIAIPAYQDYLIRSQVSEGLTMASAAKASVSEYYANKGSCPGKQRGSRPGHSGDIDGKYVSEHHGHRWRHHDHVWQRGQPESSEPRHLGLLPGTSANGDVVWKCGTRRLSRPAATRTRQLATAAATTTYLASTCRRAAANRLADCRDRLRPCMSRTRAPALRGSSFLQMHRLERLFVSTANTRAPGSSKPPIDGQLDSSTCASRR